MFGSWMRREEGRVSSTPYSDTESARMKTTQAPPDHMEDEGELHNNAYQQPYADVKYNMTWRTYSALVALSLAFSINTFTSAGPPSAIAYQVATFPADAANGSWIANAPLFPLIALTPIFGTLSDRYGKRWFIVSGCLVGVVGSAIAGSAKSMNMIIGGQAISGIATGLLQLTNPAAMEVVAAKNRPAAMGFQELTNGSLGATLSVVVFAACVYTDPSGNGEGWRWGYNIQAILYAFYGILVFVFFKPPPTELRREHAAKEMWRSIDFIGLTLLVAGLVILIVPLVQGGTTYPWSSAQAISMLTIGPLLIIAFGIFGIYAFFWGD